jgi:AraC family transcriptional regulator
MGIQYVPGMPALKPDYALFDSGCQRSSTAALRYHAVERAIVMMREHFMEPLSLQDLADVAQLSPFHFNRIFRRITGISPSVFLAALRLEQAKKLLLTTKSSVTDICFDVGYTSLGTFTSRFNLLVGMPPSRFRRLAQKEQFMHLRPQDLKDALKDTEYLQASHSGAYMCGTIHSSAPFNGLIFVGMFHDPLPQGQPVGCTLLPSPGDYYIPAVPDGHYYLFAAAMDQSQDVQELLIHGANLHGGFGKHPIAVHNGHVERRADIWLKPTSWADPPLITALPLLLISCFSSDADLRAIV